MNNTLVGKTVVKKYCPRPCTVQKKKSAVSLLLCKNTHINYCGNGNYELSAVMTQFLKNAFFGLTCHFSLQKWLTIP